LPEIADCEIGRLGITEKASPAALDKLAKQYHFNPPRQRHIRHQLSAAPSTGIRSGPGYVSQGDRLNVVPFIQCAIKPGPECNDD
jgi:hypothetical protein